MSRSKSLHDLQELDTERDRSIERRSELERILKSKGNVEGVEARIARLEQRLEETDESLRKAEIERADIKAQIERDEQRMYEGRIQSPKELNALRASLETHRHKLARWDDQALEQMVTRDELTEALESARREVVSTREQLKEKQRAASEELARTETRIAALDDRIETVRRSIPAPDLARYDRLRGLERMSGRAVADAHDGNCSACGIQLPRQLAERARAQDELVQCPGCSRLLHA